MLDSFIHSYFKMNGSHDQFLLNTIATICSSQRNVALLENFVDKFIKLPYLEMKLLNKSCTKVESNGMDEEMVYFCIGKLLQLYLELIDTNDRFFSMQFRALLTWSKVYLTSNVPENASIRDCLAAFEERERLADHQTEIKQTFAV